jgi:hypothetical protein
MKNSILVLVFCLFGSTTGFAQADEAYQANRTDFRKRILFGLKGGLNYANVYDSEGDAFEADPKLGFVGGGICCYSCWSFIWDSTGGAVFEKGISGSGSLAGKFIPTHPHKHLP